MGLQYRPIIVVLPPQLLLQTGERLAYLPGLDLPPSCIADCPLPFLQCPTSASGDGQFCSGHGSCLTATGACMCHAGYSGDGCERCAFGWSRIASGICVRNTAVDTLLLSSANQVRLDG